MVEKKYNLEITERQAEKIILALDLYTRLSTGQVDRINDITFEKDKSGYRTRVTQEVLRILQREMFPSLEGLHCSYGMHSKKLPDEIREAYDIFKVMIHEFNKDKGPSNVYADKVRQASKQPLPKFELIEK